MVSVNDKSEYGAGRKVSIDRDGEDFVVAFQPENFVSFRGKDPDAMRKVCHSLRWNLVVDRHKPRF